MKNLKAIILFFIFQLSVLCGWGQNLILNGGFEDTVDNCYDLYTNGNFSNKLIAKHWFAPTICTPDFFGSESNCPYFGSHYFGTSVLPTLNDISAGIFVYQPFSDNVREYLGGTLVNNLLFNRQYCFSIKVKSFEQSSYRTNSLGVYFSQDSLSLNIEYTKMPFIPQIEFNEIISSSEWNLFTMKFTASGYEKYFYIGVFEDDSLLSVQFIPNNNYGATYILLDDVSLTLCNDPTESTWNLYPNPSNDGTIQLNGHLLTVGILSVHNEIGQLVYSEKIAAGDFNKNYPLQLASGVYCVTINEAERSITKKVVILK